MDKKTESVSVLSEAVQPETDLAEFYYGIISKLYDFKCQQILNEIKSALWNMRKLKHEADNIQGRIYFSYKVPAVRCAYMYAYSVLHSVMVYSEFSFLLNKTKSYLLPICLKNPLKICCLGGGPGMEAAALCKSINYFVTKSGPRRESELEVDVTMIDKLPHWKREESAIVKAMNDEANLLHMKNTFFHNDFVKADLMKPFEKNLKEKIQEADIITLVKTAASIQEKSPENGISDLQNMMSNIIESMREDSCLFLLDNSGGGIFYTMKNVLQNKECPFILKASLHKDYSLDLNTLKKFGDLMKSKRNPHCSLPPTGKGKVSSCIWIKSIDASSSSSKEHQVQKEETTENNSSVESKKSWDPFVPNFARSQACNAMSKLSVIEKSQQLCSKKKRKKS